ncbi:MAG TPA: aminotransferase class III-fold pyridoxal phosphate-dependent enzyme [Gammaproteobacteria bacterium]|nr:aminotransferase class III-fold pyridoxal phosphate-dependent enzyme [Gammaproteobacteria bacterium]
MKTDRIEMETAQAIISDRTHAWHHLTQHKPFEETDPMMIVEGKGMRVKDANGREYLDAVSGGVWTVNVGYGRESIAKAVHDQLLKLCYFANTVGNIPAAQLSEKLTEKLPGMSRVYYSNSGSEANEKAYKIVRQLAFMYNEGRKHKIIFRDRDYHGTTIAALSSTGQFERKNQYGPFLEGFVEFPHCCCYRCPFGKSYDHCEIDCAKSLEKTILKEGPDTVGGVVLEPITAGGGVILPVPEYFPIIQQICRKYDVLLHIDEVVCGLGRTGKWFGHQHYDVQPDIVTMAKGVASGYAAISCTVTTEKIFNYFKADPSERMHYFRDISTFGGCTGGPAAALETIRILEEEKLLENVTVMGAYLMDRLCELQDKYPVIGDIRGKGLFVGAELVQDRASKTPFTESMTADIVANCLQQGVIVGRTTRCFQEFNNTLTLSPALIAGKPELDEIISAIDSALSATA